MTRRSFFFLVIAWSFPVSKRNDWFINVAVSDAIRSWSSWRHLVSYQREVDRVT